MNAVQAIANGLAGAGCRHVFGVPGGEVLALLDALRVAGLARDTFTVLACPIDKGDYDRAF
ncbi:MAG: hypothetical protein L3J30_04470 [Marinosulfonomonas sp.]|nr:hypothetical protein [Marinosulfonomonas sp.]